MVVKYYAKFAVYISSFTIIPALNIPLFLFRPRNSSNSLILARCFKPITSLLGLKYVIKGKEHLEKHKSFIIVSNHQSILDMLGIYECIPILQKSILISNRKLLWTGPYGAASWLAGHEFIKQSYCDQTRAQFERVLKKLEKTNEIVWIAPEGAVQNNGEMRKFKKGAFHLAIRSKVPIVPLVFSPLTFFDREKRKFDSGTVVMKVLAPIDTTNLTSENVDDLTEKVRNMMLKTFEELKH